MIQTNEYALNKRDYLKILTLLRLRSYWLLYLSLILLAALYFPQLGTDPIAVFIVVFGVIYIPTMFLYLVYYVNAKDNRNIYRPHQLSFSADKIIAFSDQNNFFDTPTTNEVAINQIIKTKEVGGFWLLYLAKNQFIAVPKSTFKSAEDHEAFKKLFNLK